MIVYVLGQSWTIYLSISRSHSIMHPMLFFFFNTEDVSEQGNRQDIKVEEKWNEEVSFF